MVTNQMIEGHSSPNKDERAFCTLSLMNFSHDGGKRVEASLM
jgi:hypothetical protein